MKKGLWLASLFFILIGCSTDDITSDNLERQKILVETAQAAEQTIDETIELIGQTMPNSQVPLFTAAPLQVEKIYKQVGDSILKGEILVRLETKEASRQVELAKKTVTNLEAALAKAKQLNAAFEQDAAEIRTLQEDLQKLINDTQEIISSSGDEQTNNETTLNQFIESSLEISLKQAQITQAAGSLQMQTPVNIKELEQQLIIAKENLRQTEAAMQAAVVSSPINGVMSELNVTEGQIAVPNIPIVTIIDLQIIQATFSANSFQVNNIQKGQKVNLFIDGFEQPFNGEVAVVSPSANPQTNSFAVQVPIKNEDNQIKAGMKTTALIQIGQIEKAVVIPINSILYEDTQPFVFFVTGDNVTRRDVVLGNRSESVIQVIEGIEIGDTVVTTGKERLTDGTEISIRNE